MMLSCFSKPIWREVGLVFHITRNESNGYCQNLNIIIDRTVDSG